MNLKNILLVLAISLPAISMAQQFDIIEADTVNANVIDADAITAQQFELEGPAILKQVAEFRAGAKFDGSNIFNGGSTFNAPVTFYGDVDAVQMLRVSKVAAIDDEIAFASATAFEQLVELNTVGAVDENITFDANTVFNRDLQVDGTAYLRDLREADLSDFPNNPPAFVGIQPSGELTALNAEDVSRVMASFFNGLEGLGEGFGGGFNFDEEDPDHLPRTDDERCYRTILGNQQRIQNSWYSNGAESIVTGSCWNPDSRVGINTQSPRGALDVQGSIFLNGSTEVEGLSFFKENASFDENMWVAKNITVNRRMVLNNALDEEFVIDATGEMNLRTKTGIDFENLNFTNQVIDAQGQQSTLFFGDRQHFIGRMQHTSADKVHKSGMYIKTYNNNGIFLKENGGVGIGFDIANTATAHAPQADLHIMRTTPSNEPVFWIQDGSTNMLKLDYDGRLYAQDITVTEPGNFPDYVFEDDYKLKSLEETETYIQENRKLPGMPSAEQVAKEGMNLNEVTRLLVEKVEELTLHMIALKKENTQLREENQAIKKQLDTVVSK